MLKHREAPKAVCFPPIPYWHFSHPIKYLTSEIFWWKYTHVWMASAACWEKRFMHFIMQQFWDIFRISPFKVQWMCVCGFWAYQPERFNIPCLAHCCGRHFTIWHAYYALFLGFRKRKNSPKNFKTWNRRKASPRPWWSAPLWRQTPASGGTRTNSKSFKDPSTTSSSKLRFT